MALGERSLAVGGVAAKLLAERYGTPIYVTDVDRVLERYSAASGALGKRYGNCLIAFALKSNSTPEVLEALAKEGSGATVVSDAGISLVKECRVPMGRVVFDGPSKSEAELASGIRAGVGMINAESVEEVKDIERLCKEHRVKERKVGFRVNFGIAADTHRGLATGARIHKFGVPREEVVRFCKSEARGLRRVRIAGLHSHVGSQIAGAGVFRRETRELLDLADELLEFGVEVEEFNLGGGLGVDYEGKGEELDIEEYAEATAGTFNRGAKPGVRLVFELGRWIVADSTVLLTRVNYVKSTGVTRWALVDAGMNDFLRPALYGAYHQIVPASVGGPADPGATYDVGGPVCESTDVFGTSRKLGVKLAQGDLLAILDAGAYGSSMASSYNMRPMPDTVLVSKGRHRLARRQLLPRRGKGGLRPSLLP